MALHTPQRSYQTNSQLAAQRCSHEGQPFPGRQTSIFRALVHEASLIVHVTCQSASRAANMGRALQTASLSGPKRCWCHQSSCTAALAHPSTSKTICGFQHATLAMLSHTHPHVDGYPARGGLEVRCNLAICPARQQPPVLEAKARLGTTGCLVQHERHSALHTAATVSRHLCRPKGKVMVINAAQQTALAQHGPMRAMKAQQSTSGKRPATHTFCLLISRSTPTTTDFCGSLGLSWRPILLRSRSPSVGNAIVYDMLLPAGGVRQPVQEMAALLCVPRQPACDSVGNVYSFLYVALEFCDSSARNCPPGCLTYITY